MNKEDARLHKVVSALHLSGTFLYFLLQFGQHAVRLQIVAEDFCSAYFVKKYFRLWQDYVTEQQIMLWEKERMAEEHDQW